MQRGFITDLPIPTKVKDLSDKHDYLLCVWL